MASVNVQSVTSLKTLALLVLQCKGMNGFIARKGFIVNGHNTRAGHYGFFP